MPPGGHTKSWQCFALCVVLRHWSISCKTFHQLINHYVQRQTDTVAFILPTNHASKVCTQTATSGTKVFDGVSVSRQKTQEMWHFLNENIFGPRFAAYSNINCTNNIGHVYVIHLLVRCIAFSGSKATIAVCKSHFWEISWISMVALSTTVNC